MLLQINGVDTSYYYCFLEINNQINTIKILNFMNNNKIFTKTLKSFLGKSQNNIDADYNFKLRSISLESFYDLSFS